MDNSRFGFDTKLWQIGAISDTTNAALLIVVVVVVVVVVVCVTYP